jgi:hypothetical protein
MGGDDVALEDWQEIARLVPDLEPDQEAADILGGRDIDVNYELPLMKTSPMGHTGLSVKGTLLLLLMLNICPPTLAIP